MKFFIDTADVDAIRELSDTGLVDGVTTNPSLVAKERARFQRGDRGNLRDRAWAGERGGDRT